MSWLEGFNLFFNWFHVNHTKHSCWQIWLFGTFSDDFIWQESVTCFFYCIPILSLSPFPPPWSITFLPWVSWIHGSYPTHTSSQLILYSPYVLNAVSTTFIPSQSLWFPSYHEKCMAFENQLFNIFKVSHNLIFHSYFLQTYSTTPHFYLVITSNVTIAR